MNQALAINTFTVTSTGITSAVASASPGRESRETELSGKYVWQNWPQKPAHVYIGLIRQRDNNSSIFLSLDENQKTAFDVLITFHHAKETIANGGKNSSRSVEVINPARERFFPGRANDGWPNCDDSSFNME